MIHSAAQLALKDISKYLKIEFPEHYTLHPKDDRYLVTATQLNTKATRKLNKELGLTHINKRKCNS